MQNISGMSIKWLEFKRQEEKSEIILLSPPFVIAEIYCERNERNHRIISYLRIEINV